MSRFNLTICLSLLSILISCHAITLVRLKRPTESREEKMEKKVSRSQIKFENRKCKKTSIEVLEMSGRLAGHMTLFSLFQRLRWPPKDEPYQSRVRKLHSDESGQWLWMRRQQEVSYFIIRWKFLHFIRSNGGEEEFRSNLFSRRYVTVLKFQKTRKKENTGKNSRQTDKTPTQTACLLTETAF